jgi:hypothetical protein
VSYISQRIDACVLVALAGTLRREGYRRSGRTFHRSVESCVQVVNIQASMGNFAVEGRFTINLGVYFPTVAHLMGQVSPIERPKEYHCAPRSRLGELLPGEADTWWLINDQTDLQAVGTVIDAAWQRYGKPWLEQCNNLQGALAFVCEHYDGYELKILLSYALNDMTQARYWVDKCLANTTHGNYGRYIRQKAQELGLLDSMGAYSSEATQS